MRTLAAVKLPQGEAGTLQTVHTMRGLIQTFRAHPAVRRVAVSITAACPRSSDACRVSSILAWVRAHVRFVRDPVSTELLHTPPAMLRSIELDGSAAGDCDDGATLTGALDQSLGIPCRLVVGSFRTDGKLHHVWAEALVSGRWVVQDPFRSERFGDAPTRVQAFPVF